jgi:radical SAM superfamily enzyme YgiQ (UPF0313 family)
MRILLVYPEYPNTFWSFRHVLRFVAKKATFPPLGLLTVAAMLPAEWDKRLVDMNVRSLSDADIQWADYVFVSAMAVQRQSVTDVIARCEKLGATVVAGGPLFTTGHEEFDGVDHFVLGEAESTLYPFLRDLQRGCAEHVYTSGERPGMGNTPVPLWSLVKMSDYVSMNIQYSRGCPFDCEFCDITVLNGRRPRTKDKEQLVGELDALYDNGWRGGVFIVDDNFIGNRKKLKQEILPAIIDWRRTKSHPFALATEASVDLADDDDLMRMMVDAGFGTVFVGIETPHDASLGECGKHQNQHRDLVASVNRIQNHGLAVQGGFILGFDSDPPSIFDRQIEFIQRSGIVTAMVGILNAPTGTRLHERLRRERRLLEAFSGNNTDSSTNFVPKMDAEALFAGHKRVIDTIYAPKRYYERIGAFLREYRPRPGAAGGLQMYHIRVFLASILLLGIMGHGRRHYWKLFFSSLIKHPRKFPMAIGLAALGYHFRRVAAGLTAA